MTLTEKQHQHLRNFAAKFLDAPGMVRCLALKSPEDVVRGALEKLLWGDSHPERGRKLTVKNRESTNAFVQCV